MFAKHLFYFQKYAQVLDPEGWRGADRLWSQCNEKMKLNKWSGKRKILSMSHTISMSYKEKPDKTEN